MVPPETVPMAVAFRTMSYVATPVPSVDAVQDKFTRFPALGVATRFVGADGCVVSIVQLRVAGNGSVLPLAVATTLKV